MNTPKFIIALFVGAVCVTLGAIFIMNRPTVQSSNGSLSAIAWDSFWHYEDSFIDDAGRGVISTITRSLSENAPTVDCSPARYDECAGLSNYCWWNINVLGYKCQGNRSACYPLNCPRSEPAPLSLNLLSISSPLDNALCRQGNVGQGKFTVQISGGVPPYKPVLNGQEVTLSGISGKVSTYSVSDSLGQSISTKYSVTCKPIPVIPPLCREGVNCFSPNACDSNGRCTIADCNFSDKVDPANTGDCSIALNNCNSPYTCRRLPSGITPDPGISPSDIGKCRLPYINGCPRPASISPANACAVMFCATNACCNGECVNLSPGEKCPDPNWIGPPLKCEYSNTSCWLTLGGCPEMFGACITGPSGGRVGICASDKRCPFRPLYASCHDKAVTLGCAPILQSCPNDPNRYPDRIVSDCPNEYDPSTGKFLPTSIYEDCNGNQVKKFDRDPNAMQCRCLSYTTRIATPIGETPVTDLKVGMLVWTVDTEGNRIVRPLIQTSHLTALNHHVVHLVLKDGRALDVSAPHPTADGRTVGDLKAGEAYDNSTVVSATVKPYEGTATYDILPAGPTGYYYANGIVMGSTLK